MGKKNCFSHLTEQKKNQHCFLGATCTLKSAVSIRVMDFEELQGDMDQGLKENSSVGRLDHQSSSCALAIMSKDIRAEKK